MGPRSLPYVSYVSAVLARSFVCRSPAHPLGCKLRNWRANGKPLLPLELLTWFLFHSRLGCLQLQSGCSSVPSLRPSVCPSVCLVCGSTTSKTTITQSQRATRLRKSMRDNERWSAKWEARATGCLHGAAAMVMRVGDCTNMTITMVIMMQD